MNGILLSLRVVFCLFFKYELSFDNQKYISKQRKIRLFINYLHRLDLVVETIILLAEDILAGDLALNLVQPLVQVVQVLSGLAELLLHGLL